MLCKLPAENEDIALILGSLCSGSVVSSIMECLSTLLISQMKIFFIFLPFFFFFLAELSHIYFRVEKSVLDNLCLWNGRLNVAEMPVLPELICRFSATPISAFFYRN